MDMAIRAAGESHPGRVRQNNEDAYYLTQYNGTVDPAAVARAGHLFVVADGVGGNRGGARASEIAVGRLPAIYYGATNGDPARTLRLAFDTVAHEIVTEAAANPERANMSCTVVAAVVKDGGVIIAHLGDARAYLLRGGALRPLTRDHTWVQMQVEKGTLTEAEAENHPDRNVITKSLGNPSFPEPTLTQIPLQEGDRLLLCSDGLCGVATDAEIAAVMTRAGEPGAAVRPLIELANRKGGPDNVTALVVQAGRAAAVAGRRSSAPLLLALVAVAAVMLGGFLFLRPRADRVNGEPAAIAQATEPNGTSSPVKASGDTVAPERPTSTLLAGVAQPTGTMTPTPTAVAQITPVIATPLATAPTKILLIPSGPGATCAPGSVPPQADFTDGMITFTWRSESALPPGNSWAVFYGAVSPNIRLEGMPVSQPGNTWTLSTPLTQFTGSSVTWQVLDTATGGQVAGSAWWCFTVPATIVPTEAPPPTDKPTRAPTAEPSATPEPQASNTPSNTDTDGDGVPDNSDQCPNKPPGDDPDPGRPGCPNPPVDPTETRTPAPPPSSTP